MNLNSNFSASFLVHEIILGYKILFAAWVTIMIFYHQKRVGINWFIFEVRDKRWCAMCIRDHHHLCFTFKRPFEAKWWKDFGSSCLKESRILHTVPKIQLQQKLRIFTRNCSKLTFFIIFKIQFCLEVRFCQNWIFGQKFDF